MGLFTGHLAAAQALVVALVFAWAGVWKVAFRRARAVAAQSALVRLLGGERQAVAAHLALGCAEIAVAGLLLLPPARTLALGCATLLALGFLGYLVVAWRIAPEAPCACMGGRVTRISWRSLARAGVLLALGIGAWPAGEFWGAALASSPWLVPLLALELAGLWLLSPELGGKPVRSSRWVMRTLRLRLDPACARVRLDIVSIERALQGTAPYRALQPVLNGPRTDAWREGCWDFVAYGAHYEQQAATVIFAAPALFNAREVSAAVVADVDNSVLLSVPSQSGALPPAS